MTADGHRVRWGDGDILGLDNVVHVLNATELCTLKWLILCCVYFTSVLKGVGGNELTA